MDPTSDKEALLAAAHAQATARLLATGRVIAGASAVLMLIAGDQLTFAAYDSDLYSPFIAWGWWAVAAAGIPSLWYAWRVRLDEGLFDDLGRALRDREIAPERALADLDSALAALDLLFAQGTDIRPLQERMRGARRLLVRQALVTLFQMLVTLSLLVPRGDLPLS
jgi:hypothetical protein